MAAAEEHPRLEPVVAHNYVVACDFLEQCTLALLKRSMVVLATNAYVERFCLHTRAAFWALRRCGRIGVEIRLNSCVVPR